MADLLPRLGAQDIVAIGPDTSLLAPLRYAAGAFADNGRQLFRWHPRPHPADLYTPTTSPRRSSSARTALAEEARAGRVVWVLLRATDWAAQKDAGRRRLPPAGRGGPAPPRAGAIPLVGAELRARPLGAWRPTT